MLVTIKRDNAPLITRFAPSPTGFLHLGHILSVAFVYGISRATGATLLLRLEDHDQTRCRPEFETSIYDDLAWFGFQFDDKPEFNKKSHLRQSDRLERYEGLLAYLANKNLVYPCDCSRAKIQQTLKDQNTDGGDELYYPGTCRHRARSEFKDKFGIRMVLANKEIPFEDGIHSQVTQNPQQQCGDVLLKDRNGNFTYQFAVVADDMDQGVNLVIRGDDLLHASGRQIMIAAALGRTSPLQFIHHPLLTDASGKKLGKRFFSEAVAKRRANGERPEDLLGQALFLAGLFPVQRPVQPAELVQCFTIAAQTGV